MFLISVSDMSMSETPSRNFGFISSTQKRTLVIHVEDENRSNKLNVEELHIEIAQKKTDNEFYKSNYNLCSTRIAFQEH